jgi:hypothetical protein
MMTSDLKSPSMPSSDDTPTDLALTGVDPGVPISLGETEVVTAWGLCDDDTPAETQSWRATWAHATVFLVCAAMAAGVIGICGWVWLQTNRDSRLPSSPQSAAPEPAPAAACTADPTCMPGGAPRLPAPPPTVTMPPAPTTTVTVQVQPPAPAAATPARSSADDAYLNALRADNIIITNPDKVIRAAHAVCTYISEGHTAHQAAAEAMAENPTFTQENASTIIGASIQMYCPELTR